MKGDYYMKKIILILFAIFSFSFYGATEESISKQNPVGVFIRQVDDTWVEYVLVGEQWYMITHYPDGSIQVTPVSKPPDY